MIKGQLDINQTWKNCFLQNSDQRTINLFCPGTKQLLSLISLDNFLFSFRLNLLYVKGGRQDKSENLMVKTTWGARKSLGNEIEIFRLSRRLAVNVELHLLVI